MLCAANALITYFGKLDNDWDQRLHLTAILPDRDRFFRANNLDLLGLNGLQDHLQHSVKLRFGVRIPTGRRGLPLRTSAPRGEGVQKLADFADKHY